MHEKSLGLIQKHLSAAFERDASNYELREAAERHGSLEWQAYRRDNGLSRYIIVSVVPYRKHEDLLFDVEGWAGAENGKGYSRVVVAQQEGCSNASEAADAASEMISNLVSRAEELGPEDLS